MITPDELLKGNHQPVFKMMNIGGSGVGKTHLAATFPKCYFIIAEPGGKDTFLYNSELRKNVVGFDEFIPQTAEDTKDMFIAMDRAISEAHQLAKQGKVETLVIDNFTYISENRWIYIDKYQQEISSRTGNVDTLAMYGKLARWCYQFTLMKVLTFPGNVVFNVHEMLESDEALEKKPDKTTPVLANILGGFRDKVDGMFSLVFFLSKIMGQDKKFHFYVRTNKGNQRNAKSRINLPEIIEDVSYKKLKEVIDKSLEI